MAKIRYFEYRHDDGTIQHPQWHYMCPGCGYIHAVSPDVHTFNGDFDKPTFKPSLVQNFTPGKMCHSFITDGYIQFLGDCTHSLANQTVELPEIKDTDI